MKRIGVAIAGGTGYGAHELLRLLSTHPEVDVVSITSRSEQGKPVSDFHRDLTGIYTLSFDEQLNVKALAPYTEQIVFTALPHGASIAYIETLLAEHPSLRVIDLSGDLRLKTAKVHSQHYPDTPLAEELRARFVYGLTELNRSAVKSARHISNPGCYPTAASLAAAPLAHHKLIDSTLVINAASGTSGAGRSPGTATHHPQRHASVTAYKALQHRHEAEVHQALGDAQCTTYETMFVPHLLPVARGIYISLYTTLSSEQSSEALADLFRDFYSGEQFIRILPQPPELADVIGSNYCDMHVTCRGKQVAVFAAEDNLVKGMAGQAIQNMNCMLGIEESLGLKSCPMGIL